MTTKSFSTQQRPDSCSNERINASEQDTISTNPTQNVSGKDNVADSQSAADSHNQADDHIVLSLQDVNVASRLWVEGISAKKGECIHIIGPNGAGKSTLLLTLAGLIEADKGIVMLQGKPMNDWSLATLASVRTLLAQQSESGFHLSVKEYLSFYSSAQRRVLIPAVLEKALEVSDFSNKILTQLSGGERQRVEICRALLQIWPQLEHGEGIALLDEPLQGLDIRHQYALASLVKFLCKNGNTILMTSHDIALSANYCDSLWLMQKGGMVASGRPHEVATQTNLENVFECHFAISKHDNFLEIQVCAPISLE
ncbi:ABC transporter ATP-binding protein [Alteromonas sp. IB21]|uniref:ABC transporter ATP-binding protein n=1 Tax=Alteromonas sp. IB21 TaxID=2779369 RepID=UPI0018E7E977|nr:ABC transporter ATP-binding protein [Alteromonas sp. IB21]MBJ2129528.1 ABC transporter ATP-binding protein [Alteromonas sp. IB21]